MTDKQIQAANADYMRLRYTFNFDRKIWTRPEVRRFARHMKKGFPQYYDYDTSKGVTFKFKTEKTKANIVAAIKVATQAWQKD
jgi:maltoporin